MYRFQICHCFLRRINLRFRHCQRAYRLYLNQFLIVLQIIMKRFSSILFKVCSCNSYSFLSLFSFYIQISSFDNWFIHLANLIARRIRIKIIFLAKLVGLFISALSALPNLIAILSTSSRTAKHPEINIAGLSIR